MAKDKQAKPKKKVKIIMEESNKQVLISYNWTQKDKAKTISNYLRSKNVLVWIDMELMEEKASEKVAEAIEESSVILVFLSSKYQDSQVCKREIEYAVKEQKDIIWILAEENYKPNGWLGMLIGNKSSYNPWKNELFNEQLFLPIISQITKFFNQPQTSVPQIQEKEQDLESTYEIEHNGKLYKLKTTAKTFQELENDIKSKLKLQQNDELVLEFNENGNFFVLDDMENLEKGMRIKVSILTQFQSHSNRNDQCWWNTKPKPNEKTKWQEKGDVDTRYIRCLLRDNKQNVVDNGNEYLKKLELLMTFFGGDMNQVNKAYVLFNEKLFDSFQHYRSFLLNLQRTHPAKFNKDDWKNENNSLQKFKFYDHYIKMAETFDWNHSKDSLHAIPMIHGTNETALSSICQTGLVITGETDAGYYGQGTSFSGSLSFSSKFARDSPDGNPLIICMVTPGNVFPVTESPYIEGPILLENPKGFINRPCKLGYQSHYILVPNDYTKFNPITGNIDRNVVNEFTVFQQAQVLPLFAIYLKQ